MGAVRGAVGRGSMGIMGTMGSMGCARREFLDRALPHGRGSDSWRGRSLAVAALISAGDARVGSGSDCGKVIDDS